MRILSWNVNGMRAAVRKGFMEWFHAEAPDVMCLQEIKATPNDLTKEIADPVGYHAIWNPAQRKGYSGVAILSKKKPKEIHLGMGVDRFDIEGRIIRLEYKNFDLLNIYFPNGTSGPERLKYKMDFYDAFLDHCEALRKEGKKLVITGDVNTAHKAIDLKNPKPNEKNSGFLPEERAWMDKFVAHGYIDTFREFCQEPDHYTWWSYRANARANNKGWRLDYGMVAEALADRLKRSVILSEAKHSDHCPILLEVD